MPCCTSRGCCSSTSRAPGSTRRAGAACGAHLRQTRAQYGTTIVLTTHYLEEAETADAVCVMAAGRIAERGTPAEIKARHASPTLEEAYLTHAGESRMTSRLGAPVPGA